MENFTIQDSILSSFITFQGAGAIVYKRTRLNSLLNSDNKATLLLLSVGMLGLRIPAFRFKAKPLIAPDNSFAYCLSNILANLDKTKELRAYMDTIPSVYQELVVFLFSSRFYKSKLEDIVLDKCLQLHSRSEILSMLPKPTFNITSLNVEGLDKTEVTFPALLFYVPMSYKSYSVGYIDIDGIVTKSNVSGITVRNFVLHKAKLRRGRVYFLYHNKIKTHTKGAVVLAQVFDNKDVTPLLDNSLQINSEDELVKAVMNKPRRGKVIVHTGGVEYLNYKSKVIRLKANDYVVDDNYNIVKLCFTIYGKEVILPAKVEGEINLNKDRFKVMVYSYAGEARAFSFLGHSIRGRKGNYASS